MSFAVRRLVQLAFLASCVVVAAAKPVFAQGPQPLAQAPVAADFMTRFDWRMSAALLQHPDPRFTWDTHWAGDFDLFSYPKGRATFLADYQALLGSEFRPFDPYQSNYQLEASGSYFAGKTEIAGVLSHISRHLGDRAKRIAVAENSLGPRLLRHVGADARSLDVRVDMRKVIARAYDDYAWIGELDLTVRQRISPRNSVYARGYGELIQVDQSIANRGNQRGGKIEAGVKVQGSSGAMEFFAGGEQMIDADPLDRLPRRWGYIGFRLLGR